MIRKAIIAMLTLGAAGTGALWIMSHLDWPGVWWCRGTVGAYSYRLGHSAPPPEGPTWAPNWSLLAWHTSGRAVELTAYQGSLLILALTHEKLAAGRTPPVYEGVGLLGFELGRSPWRPGMMPFYGSVPESLLPGWHRVQYNVRVPFWAPLTLFAAYPVIAFIRVPLRRWRRRRKGLCLKCGYDLTSNVSRVCPECGQKT